MKTSDVLGLDIRKLTIELVDLIRLLRTEQSREVSMVITEITRNKQLTQTEKIYLAYMFGGFSGTEEMYTMPDACILRYNQMIDLAEMSKEKSDDIINTNEAVTIDEVTRKMKK